MNCTIADDEEPTTIFGHTDEKRKLRVGTTPKSSKLSIYIDYDIFKRGIVVDDETTLMGAVSNEVCVTYI